MKLHQIRINKLGSRSLSGKLNSSSTQGSTHSVTWSLELVTIIAMPPTQKTFCLNDQAQIAWFTSTRGVYWSSPQYGTIWYSTVQYSMVWYSTVQRVDFYFTMGTKCAKGQRVKRSKCHRGSLKVRSSQEHISSELVSWRRSILFNTFVSSLMF